MVDPVSAAKTALKRFVTTPPRWCWNYVPPKVRWALIGLSVLVTLVFYFGRGQAIVLLPFQLPTESKEYTLPFNGVTVANVLRDAIIALRQEAAGRLVPPPCDFLATEDRDFETLDLNSSKNFEGLSFQSSTSYLGPNASSGFSAGPSASFQIHGPVNVEVGGVSLNGILSWEWWSSLARYLLGHDKFISGDLVLDGPDSLQLVARSKDDGPWTVSTEKASLSGLKKASCSMAEQILRSTDRNVIAAALIRRGKYNDVVGLYGTLAIDDPQNADALNNLAVALYMTGRVDESLTKLHQALALRPNLAEAHANLGNVFGCKGRHSQAVAEFKKALQLNPHLLEAERNLGMGLSIMGQWDQSVAAYKKAIELKPDDPENHVFLGTVLVFAQKIDEAAPELKKALDLVETNPTRTPDRAEVHRGVGLALNVAGKSEEAIAEYKKAIEIKPDLIQAYTELAHVFLEHRRADEAVSLCGIAVTIKPDSPYAHMCFADALSMKAEDLLFSPLTTQVITEYKKAIELKPDFAEAHNALGVTFFLSWQLDESISELKKAIELDPNYAEAHETLGMALNKKRRYDEAAVELERAFALKPDLPDLKANLREALDGKAMMTRRRILPH